MKEMKSSRKRVCLKAGGECILVWTLMFQLKDLKKAAKTQQHNTLKVYFITRSYC